MNKAATVERGCVKTMTKKLPEVSNFPLEPGKPTPISSNRPVKFRIVFQQGTYIEGIIPPNTSFTVCNYGDIREFIITVDDDSLRPVSLVGPSDDEDDGALPG